MYTLNKLATRYYCLANTLFFVIFLGGGCGGPGIPSADMKMPDVPPTDQFDRVSETTSVTCLDLVAGLNLPKKNEDELWCTTAPSTGNLAQYPCSKVTIDQQCTTFTCYIPDKNEWGMWYDRPYVTGIPTNPVDYKYIVTNKATGEVFYARYSRVITIQSQGRTIANCDVPRYGAHAQ